MKEETKKDNTARQKWFDRGYTHGLIFSRKEADYEELAAVAREKAIPARWDIFRAEILNQFLQDPSFDFQAYSKGFGCSCKQFFNTI